MTARAARTAAAAAAAALAAPAAAAPAAAALAATGCTTHRHLPRNAPGHVAVETPPAPLAAERLDPPEDPGENFLVLSGGLYTGGGGRFHEVLSADGIGQVGAEVTLQRGCHFRSHHDDALFLWPYASAGVNVGWTFLDQDGLGVGPLYLEVQGLREALGGAIGWAWDPDDGRHGPQGTVFAGPFYARATVIGGATEVTFGVFWKGWASWVWSR